MTVKQYLENRSSATYGKKVRVIDLRDNKNTGDWTLYAERPIFRVNVTTKYIFIYIN
jgi:hypothetical protein